MATNQPNVTSEEDETVEKPPRWLVFIVIFLGLAIIGMLVLMVVKIIAGDNRADSDTTSQGSLIEAAIEASRIDNTTQPASYLKEVSVVRPVGGTLEKVEVNGRDLLMHFRLKDGGDLILVLDRVTGETSRVLVP